MLVAATVLMTAGLFGDAGLAEPDPSEPEVLTPPAPAETWDELQDHVDALAEEVEDLEEPVEEFETFDQCMYLLGVTAFGGAGHGYVSGPGAARHGPALAIDIRGLGAAEYQFMAFPGEEPPSIECNEDAAGQFTN